MDIILAFIALCNSILPHIKHLEHYSNQHLGAWKRNHRVEYDFLKNVLETDIKSSNFHSCFKKLLEKLIETLKKNPCSSDLKPVEVIIDTFNNNNKIFEKQFDSSDLEEFNEHFEFLVSYASNITIFEDENTQPSQTASVITQNNTDILTVSYFESKLKDFMSTIESKLNQLSIPKIITSSYQNNTNNKDSDNNTLIDNINNFHEAHNLVKNKYNKNIRYKHHIDTLTEHIKYKTSPPTLFFNRFPTPMLHDDSNFINEYNNLIQDFQKNTMNLIINTLKNRIEHNNTELINIKNKFNDDDSIDIKFKNIEESVQSELKGWLQNKHYSNSKYKTIPFKVINHINYNNEKNNHNNNNNLNKYHNNNNNSNKYNNKYNNIDNIDKNYNKQNNNNYQPQNNSNFNKKTNNTDIRISRSRNYNHMVRSTSQKPIRSVSRSSNFSNSLNNNNKKNSIYKNNNNNNNNIINNDNHLNNNKPKNYNNNNNNKNLNKNRNNINHDQINFPQFQPQPLMQFYQQPQPPHLQQYQQLEPLPQRQQFQNIHQNQHFLQPPNFLSSNN